MGKMVMGPKHKPAERTAIYEPTTKDLLTDEQKNTRSNPKIQRRSTHKEQSTTTRLGSDKRKTTTPRQDNDRRNKKIRRTTN